MQNYFVDLLEQFNQADNRSVKNTIYDAMVEYADSYHPGYTCYDMDMFVALYKCARTNKQRKHALEHIQDIIVDDYQYHDELIQNFKEFTLIKEFLNENDEEVFDGICKEFLDFFIKQKEESEFEAGAGQADFIPDVPVWEAHRELKEVAEIIVGTDMRNLESYQKAREVLGIGTSIGRKCFLRFFLSLKKFDKNKIVYYNINIKYFFIVLIKHNMKHLQKRKNELDKDLKRIGYNPLHYKEKKQKEKTLKSIEDVLEKRDIEEAKFLKEKNIHLEDDPLYKKAKEENNLELLEKLKNRLLTPREYYENLYDEVKDFGENLLLVKQDGKRGLIDSNTGDIKLQIKYEEINRFLGNYLRVKQDGKYGLIDSSIAFYRDNVVPTEYEDFGDVQEVKKDFYSTKEGYYTYKAGGKYGLIDVKNKHVLNPMYESIKWVGDNLFEVSKDGKKGLIPDIFFGSAVTYCMPCIYDEISDFGHAGAKGFYKFSKGNSVGIFSLKEEKEIITLSGYHDIRYHRDAHGGEFRVRNNEHGYWEVYDKKGGYRTKVEWL